LTTGAATLVGFVGHVQGSGNALAFDPSDTLYNVVGADIYTVNQSDGFATDTGTNVQYPVNLGTNPRTNAMDYDLTTPGGTLYASVAHSIPGDQAATTNFIAEIDLTTGAVTNPKLTITGLDGLAVLPEQMGPPNNTPETMSTLWLLPILIGLFAFRRFEAQKRSNLLIESHAR
jgi:hypothetical protein